MTWVERNTGLVKEGWWEASTIADNDILVVYQPKGALSIANSYVNLVDPGVNDATPVIAPNWNTTDGWTFTGTQGLGTGIIGNGSQSMLIWLTNPIGASHKEVSGYFEAVGKRHFINVLRTGATTAIIRHAYNTSTIVPAASTIDDADNIVLCMARNKAYIDGTLIGDIGSLDTWTSDPITIGAELTGVIPAADFFEGDIKAYAIYNKELSQAEITILTTQIRALADLTAKSVNWIIQNPSTRHLSNKAHELWIATDDGLYHTFNGGRGWANIPLPDPSNAEFGDNPAATIDELTFHWINYDRGDETILYALGAKSSASRIWVYKATNSGVNIADWSSRGVTW